MNYLHNKPIATWLFIVGLYVLIVFKSCVYDKQPQPVVLQPAVQQATVLAQRVDSIPHTITLPRVTISASNLKERVVWNTTDTLLRQQIAKQLYVIDSLKAILKQSVKLQQLAFGLDSIHTVTHDTLSVTCDELHNAVLVDWRFANRTVNVPHTTQIVGITAEERWGVGAGIGYGLTINNDNVIRGAPVIGVTLYYKLLGW